jgi:hypothetical protein
MHLLNCTLLVIWCNLIALVLTDPAYLDMVIPIHPPFDNVFVLTYVDQLNHIV